jgi:pimeloyl-ACP methyl ester carboxylesterase
MSTQPGDGGVLFLGGAGLPGWIWDEVRADLSENTDTVVVRYPRGGDVSLADYADAALAQAPWPVFAVVAHSIGGVIADELLARHPGRVTGVLGVSAAFPRAGHSFVGSMPLPARFVLGAVLRMVGTRPPAKLIRTGLASGLPDVTVNRIIADFDPESVRLYRDACSAARELPAVRAYLHTSQDKEFTTAMQRGFAETLQATWAEEVSTGHLPMLQDPAGVSRAVRRLLAASAEAQTST